MFLGRDAPPTSPIRKNHTGATASRNTRSTYILLDDEIHRQALLNDSSEAEQPTQ